MSEKQVRIISEDELTPTDYLRISYSGLSVDLKKKLDYIQDVIKEFDSIIKSINRNLDRLKTVEDVSDKHLFIDMISFLPIKTNIKYDVIDIGRKLEEIIGYHLSIGLRFRTEQSELDSGIRSRIKMIIEKSEELIEDETIKKVFRVDNKLFVIVNEIDKYKEEFERKLRRKIRKKVGTYDIDAFLIKQMLEI
jgi:hypothetical protein